MTRPFALLVALLAAAGIVAPPRVAAQMPNLSQMSGTPLPTGDLPDATVSIRVVRGGLENNVVGQVVEMHGGGQVWNATTDADGRATFAGIPPGTSVHAHTTVDGQSLESREFTVPSSGGMRVILVAGAPAGAPAPGPGAAAGAAGGGQPAAPSAPAQAGTVTFGTQSRMVVEIVDEAVDVYVLLDVVNGGQAPIDPQPPLAFDVQPEGRGVTLLQGSTPAAKVEGNRVTVAGPLAPGRTIVQFAYQLPYDSSHVTVRQTLPAALPQTSVLVRKFGTTRFTSPQVAEIRDVPMDGQAYALGTGPALPAGGTIEVALSGLPHHSPVPRYTSLALAVLIVGIGIWLARAPGGAANAAEREKLERRREQLFGELVKLEEQHRAGRGDPARYEAKRRDLVDHLTQVLGELDDLSPGAAGPVAGARPDGLAVDAPLRTRRA